MPGAVRIFLEVHETASVGVGVLPHGKPFPGSITCQVKGQQHIKESCVNKSHMGVREYLLVTSPDNVLTYRN